MSFFVVFPLSIFVLLSCAADNCDDASMGRLGGDQLIDCFSTNSESMGNHHRSRLRRTNRSPNLLTHDGHGGEITSSLPAKDQKEKDCAEPATNPGSIRVFLHHRSSRSLFLFSKSRSEERRVGK